MTTEKVSTDTQSHLEQQQDPRGDLLKARPGGATEPSGLVPPYDKNATSEPDGNS